MPDWSYHPIFKPVLFRMAPAKARDLTLWVIGALAKAPFGVHTFDFFGHMRPSASLKLDHSGKEWSSPVGLGAGLVFDQGALLAFSRFGFGHIEVGPVTVLPVPVIGNEVQRDSPLQTLSYQHGPVNPGLQAFLNWMPAVSCQLRKQNVRLGMRIANSPQSSHKQAVQEYMQLAAELHALVDFLAVDSRWWNQNWTQEEIRQLMTVVASSSSPGPGAPLILLSLSPAVDDRRLEMLVNVVVKERLSGMMVAGGVPQGEHWICGATTAGRSLELMSKIRRLAPDIVIFGSGGIMEPVDALRFFNAGATHIQLHSGLVFSGPGLAKRINEAITYARAGNEFADRQNGPNAGNPGAWIPFAMIAVGLIVTSLSAVVVGLTEVVLPYDLSFLGISRASIPVLNQHLLQFMSHDRVTLAGTSLSGAILFFSLAVFGIRRGHRWAYLAEVIALAAGFAAFFLFLGFHYFDPLHALVVVILLPFFIWGIAKPPRFVAEQSGNLYNDKRWMMGVLGQLFFVVIGFGLLLAGVTIAMVGCSTVFVPEDLMFMKTTAASLSHSNTHLFPLIAHDRAGFGGSLWAVGLAELLISLWGFRQGQCWVWWTLLLGGLPGFIAVFGIHLAIGYLNFVHLAPACIAVVLYVSGLCCSHDFLCARPDPLPDEISADSDSSAALARGTFGN